MGLLMLAVADVQPLSGRTVAVTGATGFLGSHLAQELARQGARVVGVVRTPAKGAWLEDVGVSFRAADLADLRSLTAAFDGANCVVANAALSPGRRLHDESAFVETNVRGTENTLRAASEAGVKRVILISTVAVYRTRLFHSVREDGELLDPERPRFDINQLTTNKLYSRTKALAERRAWELAASLDLQLTALRPGPIYGPRDGKMTARYATWMESAVRFVPTVRIPHVHAGDVAVAVAGAVQNVASAGRAFNVTGEPVSLYRVLATWKRLAGRGPLLIPIPVPLQVRFDDSAARETLGFAPRSIEDGILDVLRSRAGDAA